MHGDDIALVKALLKGDNASFNLFYNTYFPRIYRFCRLRLDDEDACKDIVQQTLTNAMRALNTYRGEASLLTWLCQIGRNEIAAWCKKNRRHQQESFDHNPGLLAAIESMPSSLEGQAISQPDDELRALVQTSLDSLPSSYGKVLELKYIEGLSVNEIAEALQTGEVAIQSLLARARTAFKQVFVDLQKELQSP